MTIGVDTARFRRPADLNAIRRNNRQVQAQRILVIALNVCVVIALALAISWIYQRTQRDQRFSVQRVVAKGNVHTSSSAIASITDRYTGGNLFRLDTASLQRDLLKLPWVSRVAIEKKIPDTLSIRVFEREPVALLLRNGQLRYLDAKGVDFAPLSARIGNPELPLVTAEAEDAARAVAFVQQVKTTDASLYSRISEVSPVGPSSFAVFDRELQTSVLVNATDWQVKWRDLYSVAQKEGFGAAAIEYADLRFNDRIVIRPRKIIKAVTVQKQPTAPGGITN